MFYGCLDFFHTERLRLDCREVREDWASFGDPCIIRSELAGQLSVFFWIGLTQSPSMLAIGGTEALFKSPPEIGTGTQALEEADFGSHSPFFRQLANRPTDTVPRVRVRGINGSQAFLQSENFL